MTQSKAETSTIKYLPTSQNRGVETQRQHVGEAPCPADDVATIRMVETRWKVAECRAGYERLLLLLFRPGLRRQEAVGGAGAREETEVA